MTKGTGLDSAPTSMDVAEAARLLGLGRPRSASVTTPRTLTERVEACVDRSPDAIAVSFEGLSLTYRELDRRANRLAHRLVSLGAGPDTLVGVCMDRGLDMVVSLFAVLKAGAAYLPLDLVYPRDRLEFMLSDSQAVALLSTRDCLASLPQVSCPTVFVDEFAEPTTRADDVRPGVPVAPDSLAYVIYTSGSTGKPKGCRITHRNVGRLFDATEHWFGFGPSDVWTFFHSHAFDFSVWEIWGALIYGGRVVVVPYLTSRAPELFLSLLKRERVTVLNQTPSAFKQLILADQALPRADDLALRLVIFGGEALELRSLQAWMDRYGDERPALVNMYGITETTVHVTYRRILARDLAANLGSVIGEPIPDLGAYVLDSDLRPAPQGTPGEIFVGGAGVCGGYLNRPELTSERFLNAASVFGVLEPAAGLAPGARLYRTGDLGRWTPGGELEHLGRIDEQVKIRGFRIETGEIEAALLTCPGVGATAVIARTVPGQAASLVAFVVPQGAPVSIPAVREQLRRTLPEYMLPESFVALDALPLTPNGKLDRRALQELQALPGMTSDRKIVAAQSAEEDAVCAAYAGLLGLERVGRTESFFELGGNSLKAVQAAERLSKVLSTRVATTDIFNYPTPARLVAAVLGGRGERAGWRLPRESAGGIEHEPIAIIGMSGRFPGAVSVEGFWQNLVSGRDCISELALDTLDPSIPPSLRADPAYVPARGLLEGVEDFDPAFFGFTQREGELLDPQIRVLLELSWEALERAGYPPDACRTPVGVFAGMYHTTYLAQHLATHPELAQRFGAFNLSLLNDKDYVATRIAHRLNLVGPAVSVYTACSTSLVAVVQAVNSLRAGQCDMALAGGAAITCPPRSGYLYEDGGMLSKDGRTRAFSRDGTGTTFSDGAAVVLLKRLSDAIADRDPIVAVIKGVAINNDGRDKASFTAPNSDGQASVIEMAHRAAGIDARSISYVEAHGTATPVGDPIEIEGLTRAFRRTTTDRQFCAIGSVKSNVGHLVMAAGAAGLIKTALALRERVLPASLHFDAPNPAIDFENSPFRVWTSTGPWPAINGQPLRAGVSSFGVGGTNAHVVLEEAPRLPVRPRSNGPWVLPLSARSPQALARLSNALADHLAGNPQLDLGDVAFTLRRGRSAFASRRAVAVTDLASAITALRAPISAAARATSGLALMFPGQGAQYPGMGRRLYESDPVFRAAFDQCVAAFAAAGLSALRERIFEGTDDTLAQTNLTQPALFAVEYALGRLLLHRGLQATALVGHSIGEFVAATLAGVMTLDDAARIVEFRGRVMHEQPRGAMLSVRAPASRIEPLLPMDLSLAADNSPLACVVSGTQESIERYVAELGRDGIACRTLQTSHAFHSRMMLPAAEAFEKFVAGFRLQRPTIRIVSTMTGQTLTDEQARSPRYWAAQLRNPVRFSPAMQLLIQEGVTTFVEAGPRATLSTLLRQHQGGPQGARIAIPTFKDSPDGELIGVLDALGQAWTAGQDIDLGPAEGDADRCRLTLPTYPFERVRCWVDPLPASAQPVVGAVPAPFAAVAADPTATAQPPASNLAAAPAQTVESVPLVARIAQLIDDICGLDLRDADPEATFAELGLDSLTLTQVAMELRKTFGLTLTFRQLMTTYSGMRALTDAVEKHIATTLPAANPEAPSAGSSPGIPARSAAAAAPPAPVTPQPAVAAQSAVPPGPPLAARSADSSTSPPAEERELAHSKYDVKKAFGAIARIHQRTGALSPRQQARLDAFVRRYVAMTQKSKAFTDANRDQLADPRVVNGFRPELKEIIYQLVVDRSKGSRVWDLDGNEYIDVLNGFGMNMLGWQPDFVLEAARAQLDKGYEIGPQHPLAADVAHLMCELTGFDRAALCNTGSEAVLGTLRIARTVTGRSKIVIFTGSYHGIFDEVLVRGTRKLRSVPAAPGILGNTLENVIVLDYGTPESLEIIRSMAHELAAVLVEPVQSRRPDFQPREFLQSLREITAASGSVFIMDEVITGFRCHPRGIRGLFGIDSDLATYGKVIGGGFPIGVIAGKRAFMDALDGGGWRFGDDSTPTVGVTYFAGTFVRHPLALAAAKASLEHFRDAGPALQERLTTNTTKMADEMNAFLKQEGVPIEIRHFASLWRVTFLEDHPYQDLLFAMMRSRGIHILENFPCFLTTSHTEEDLRKVVSVFREAVRELCESEFIPHRPAKAATATKSGKPPVEGARLGRDKNGKAAWFVPDPDAPGKFVPLN